MPSTPLHLCIAVRFLDGRFHGRRDGGEPEWPPSPLRVFQALVAAAAAYTNERNVLTQAGPFLQWLEAQSAPTIIAPINRPGAKYRLYVPDNVGDLVAKSWQRGNEGSIADYRSEKDLQPTHLIGSDAVYYLWSLTGDQIEFFNHWPTPKNWVRAITHLGWGIDMVVADANLISDDETEQLSGERWRPIVSNSQNLLRVPMEGTLEDLNRRYAAFLQRVRPDGFVPVPPLKKFQNVSYLNGTKSPSVPFVAFDLLTPSADGFRPFDPVRNGMRVAAMLRHAAGSEAIASALGWPDEKVKHMVHGHAEPTGETYLPSNGPRFAFVPLPSIEARGKGKAYVVGSARRALILGVRGTTEEETQKLARMIAGQPLTDQDRDSDAAILARIPISDRMVSRYTKPAATWATVTPLVLPGYDDPKKYRREISNHPDGDASAVSVDRKKELLGKLDRRIEFLIRKAICQSGFTPDQAKYAEIEWSNSGFWPGTDLATRYAIPASLRRFRRLHVRITWKTPDGKPLEVQGPLCIGGGRFVGLGLFAPC